MRYSVSRAVFQDVMSWLIWLPLNYSSTSIRYMYWSCLSICNELRKLIWKCFLFKNIRLGPGKWLKPCDKHGRKVRRTNSMKNEQLELHIYHYNSTAVYENSILSYRAFCVTMCRHVMITSQQVGISWNVTLYIFCHFYQPEIGRSIVDNSSFGLLKDDMK